MGVHFGVVLQILQTTLEFLTLLDAVLRQSRFQPIVCLGAQGIRRIMTLVQNAVISRGYTTTRILTVAQDLKSDMLEQWLENLKRIPTAEADIRIELGAQPNKSNALIMWRQHLRLSSPKIIPFVL